MFVRFSKRNGNPENERNYRRAVAINSTYLVQEGNDIVAFGRLKSNSQNEYDIWIVDNNHTDVIERYTKRFIGNSIKWENQSSVKRKYNVTYVGQSEINNFNFKIQVETKITTKT